jgi:hypothetical protein
MRAPLLLLALLAASPTASAASLQDDYRARAAAVDRRDPDALVTLGRWCREAGLHAHARRHFTEAMKLDPDHLGARSELGFTRTLDGRWVVQPATAASAAPVAVTPVATPVAPPTPPARPPQRAAPEPEPEPEPTAPPVAPTAPPSRPVAEEPSQRPAQPPLPAPDEGAPAFVAQLVDELAAARPESPAAEIAARSLSQSQYLPLAVQRLGQALALGADPGPAAQVVQIVLQQRLRPDAEHELARQLAARLPAAMTPGQSPAGLRAAVSAVGLAEILAAVPALTALLDHGNADLAASARAVAARLTFQDASQVDSASLTAWWQANGQLPPNEVAARALRAPSPASRLAAARFLGGRSDKRAVPVLIELLKDDAPPIHGAAASELGRLIGNDGGIERGSDAAVRLAAAKRLTTWWKGIEANYVFPAQCAREASVAGQQAAAAPSDALRQNIERLAMPDATEARNAQRNLRLELPAMAVRLVDEGLGHSNAIVRGRVLEILVEQRGQGGDRLGFEPFRGSDAERAAARERWRAWAATAATTETP